MSTHKAALDARLEAQESKLAEVGGLRRLPSDIVPPLQRAPGPAPRPFTPQPAQPAPAPQPAATVAPAPAVGSEPRGSAAVPAAALPLNPSLAPVEPAIAISPSSAAPKMEGEGGGGSVYGGTKHSSVELAKRIRAYQYRPESVPLNLQIRAEAYSRLVYSSLELNVPNKSLLTYLLDEYLPKPTQAFLPPDPQVGKDLRAQRDLFAARLWVPKWMENYAAQVASEQIRRDRSGSFMADLYIRLRLQEISTVMAKVESIEAIIYHALPEAKREISPRRRARRRS